MTQSPVWVQKGTQSPPGGVGQAARQRRQAADGEGRAGVLGKPRRSGVLEMLLAKKLPDRDVYKTRVMMAQPQVLKILGLLVALVAGIVQV